MVFSTLVIDDYVFVSDDNCGAVPIDFVARADSIRRNIKLLGTDKARHQLPMIGGATGTSPSFRLRSGTLEYESDSLECSPYCRFRCGVLMGLSPLAFR